ncbi:glycerophosphodiester phosphodiesterase [Streptomyces apocyni]|uniref:glycerophosphodiester phosphodiesterase n=1 Tax=Streptomyces apocyni TaxID=2654677 RepID=UPI0012EAD2E9|nr:glycerophosphodiester phosphodiesterase [Streptomyces apocyni]
MVTSTVSVMLMAMTLTGPAGSGGAPTPLEWRGSPLTVDSLSSSVTYTAHRGGALEVPENSMSGLMATYLRGTAQVLDVDFRMLRDGTLVALHDRTLDRTTNETGPVRDLTREDWERVRLRPDPALPGRWRAERPPTVDEVLDRLGGRVLLMLEAKDPASLPVLAEKLRARGLTRSVFVNSNEPAVARQAHELGLIAQLWRSARQLRDDDPRQWRDFVDILDVNHEARDKDLLRAVRSGIGRVWAHTVNTPKELDRVLRLGCDGVLTDSPGLLARTPASAG